MIHRIPDLSQMILFLFMSSLCIFICLNQNLAANLLSFRAEEITLSDDLLGIALSDILLVVLGE